MKFLEGFLFERVLLNISPISLYNIISHDCGCNLEEEEKAEETYCHPSSVIFYFPLVRPRLLSREPVIKEMGVDSVRLQWSRAELPYYVRQVSPITYSVEMQEVRHRHVSNKVLIFRHSLLIT